MIKVSKSIFVWGAVLVVLAVVAAVIFIRQNVEVMSPRRGDVVESIYGLGSVVSEQSYAQRIATPLTVKNVFVREGDQISAGDRIMQGDDVVFKSPIAGTVSLINFKVGELATSQSALFQVINLSRLYLEVGLEQQYVMRVKPAQKVVVLFESLRNQRLVGKVTSVYPRDNQFVVHIDLETWPEGVLPGMTADVAIEVAVKKDTLLIPIAGIRNGHVTVLRGGRRIKTQVTLGVVDDQWAEALGTELTVEDQIILVGK
jgi:membrane fusion protein, macrolide-specific efflux system